MHPNPKKNSLNVSLLGIVLLLPLFLLGTGCAKEATATKSSPVEVASPVASTAPGKVDTGPPDDFPGKGLKRKGKGGATAP